MLSLVPQTADIERDHLLGLPPQALRASLAQRLGDMVAGYRADQILHWVHRQGIVDFAGMVNLPQELRRELELSYRIYAGTVAAERQSTDGTRKLLITWLERGTSECVLIPTPQRRTACISTQVGCPVRCAFCASGIDGLQRNLTAGQIVEQAHRIAALCSPESPLTNVVFMGLGEPLANYAATVAALRIINAPWGLGIGARRITLSTVGLPSQMKRLADERLQITLALSLHAPTDELRRQLIPWAERVTIEELTGACRYYFEHTGREVTLEYILLARVNDTPEQAQQLAAVSRRMRSNVNLIAYNPVVDLGFGRPSDATVQRFRAVLQEEGVNVHVRTSRGLDIDAACGQLRRRHANASVAGAVPAG